MSGLVVIVLVATCWCVVLGTYAYVARRDGQPPADDIGIVWLFVMALYATIPPLAWWLQGAYYGASANPRLYVLEPTAGEVCEVLQISLAYVVAFAFAYVATRRRTTLSPRVECPRIDAGKLIVAAAIVLLFKAVMLVLRLRGVVRASDSYIDSYVSMNELPIVTRQLIKIGSGIATIAQLVFLVGLLQRPRLRVVVAAYVLALLLSFDPEGARTAVVTGLLAAAVAWHVLVRPIRARWWLAAITVGILAFLALGARRGFESSHGSALLSLNLGEFDSLWANNLELLADKAHHWTHVPFTTRFGELWAFVPSQLLPFEKTSLSIWFVDTFQHDYAQQGGGFAFGAVAQAVIGGGIIEALLRGALLGWIAGRLVRWHRTPTRAWWHLPLYLYLLVTAYESVRDTTFSELGNLVQIVIPALFVIWLIGRQLSRDPAVATSP
jgi:hypothetical protein